MFLFIDTCQSWCNLAIVNDGKILNKLSIKTNNNLTDVIVEKIASLLKKTKVNKLDIDSIYLTIGPGSFTGIRVNMLIAKTWSLVNNTNIYYISSLELQRNKIKKCISIIDAKNKRYYCSIYNNNKTIILNELVSAKEIDSYKEKYKSFKIVQDVNSIDIFMNNLDTFKKVDVNQLQPLYIKKPIS
jgi:tRNA threonylcarbamoyl adenosine modification protein YeaZ